MNKMYSIKAYNKIKEGFKNGEVTFDSQGTSKEPVLERIHFPPCSYSGTMAHHLKPVQPIDLNGGK